MITENCSVLKPGKAEDSELRALTMDELDAVSGAGVRYYVMRGTWWVCGTDKDGNSYARNTGIPAS
jgi:hypothetical protein